MSVGMSIHVYDGYTQAWWLYGLMFACMHGLIHDMNSYAHVEHATTS